ncbi:DNA repair protein RecO [Patescibacteria group bacterium]|nr:DNA repair protein RecO [Patescibacteria group bacterium]
MLDKFENIKKSLTKIKISYKIAKSLDNLLRIEEKDENLWRLLKEVFGKLDNWEQEKKSWKLQIVYYYFLWNFFSVLGYQPELYKCASCQKKLIASFLYFSAEEGGIVCPKCANGKKKINADVVKILRLILKKDWLILFKLKIQPTSWKLLKEVSEHYYSHLLSIHSFEEDFQKDNEPL